MEVTPPIDPVASMLPNTRTGSTLPEDEPYATPMRPSRIDGSPRSPASSSAISVARTAKSETRPMDRISLRG